VNAGLPAAGRCKDREIERQPANEQRVLAACSLVFSQPFKIQPFSELSLVNRFLFSQQDNLQNCCKLTNKF